jgi:hypothetical protein
VSVGEPPRKYRRDAESQDDAGPDDCPHRQAQRAEQKPEAQPHGADGKPSTCTSPPRHARSVVLGAATTHNEHSDAYISPGRRMERSMRQDVPVADPASYFADRGFSLKFVHCTDDELEHLYLAHGSLSRREYERLRSTGAVGPVLANLISDANAKFVLRAYGTGQTEEEAAARARARWRTEQGD